MHAALQLTEISDLVCQFLDRPTLALLARTCRAFEGPALDALWKVIKDLRPLASLLPDSMFEEDPSNMYGYNLLQPLSPQQRKLVRKYTSRITVIESCSLWSPAVNKLKAVAVCSIPPSEPLPILFPRLKMILDASCTDDQVALFRRLNAPCLTRLDITFLGDPVSDVLIDFVSSMSNLYPSMQSFFLIAKAHENPAMIRSVSEAIRSWKHLVCVDLNTAYLDATAYEHLMQLQSLTSLTLRLCDHFLSHLRQACVPRNPFPHLTDLILLDRVSLMVEWLNHLHVRLHSLSCAIYCSLEESPLQIAQFCGTIEAQLCNKSLETISVVNHHHLPIPVLVDSIRPLFSFSRLRCIEIPSLCTVFLSDDHLRALAASWPFLEILDIGSTFRPNNTVPIPSVKGFLHLLRHCPRLQKLSILIDTRYSESMDIEHHLDGIRNHPMSHLSLGNSPLDNPVNVASMLSAALPSLRQVDLTCWSHFSFQWLPEVKTVLPLWEQMNHHLGTLYSRRITIARLAAWFPIHGCSQTEFISDECVEEDSSE